jgi:ATP-dependent NAD(P)H-hydrate dehydratase
VIVMHRAQDKSRQDEFTKRSHDSFKLWFPRMSALIVGPGLGRDPAVLACAVVAIREAASLSIPIVIDADGLFLLCQQPEILDGYRHVVLTPNTAELKRLVDNLKITTDERRSPSRYSHVSASTKVPVNPETVQQGLALSARSALKFCAASHCCSPWDLECSLLRFEGVTVYCKGTTDAIVCQPPGGSKSTLFIVIESFTFCSCLSSHPCPADGGEAIIVFGEEAGSPRRCGGQGDVASGCIATFLGWAKQYRKPHGSSVEAGLTCDKLVACALAGSSLLRRAASIAFAAHHRATTTPDIIGKIGLGFSQLFETEASPRL